MRKVRPALGDRPGDQRLLAFETAPPPVVATPPDLRRVAAGSEFISYRLQRGHRRTIGFQIDDSGLTIRAPRWITLREIEAAIIGSQRWIHRKQIAWSNWRQQHSPVATCFADGGTVQYLGATATLRWARDVDAGHTGFDAAVREIRLSLPFDCPPGAAADAVARQALQVWLQSQARLILEERLDGFSGRIDARFKGWRLSSARTQWGSCSHDGRIRLNWRLVHFSPPVIDYVIAHELAHLRELNHSARFWSVVAQLMPGFEAARDQIKRVDIKAVSF